MGPWRAAQRFLVALPGTWILRAHRAGSGRPVRLAGQDRQGARHRHRRDRLVCRRRPGHLRHGADSRPGRGHRSAVSLTWGARADPIPSRLRTWSSTRDLAAVPPQRPDLHGYLEDGTSHAETYYSIGGGFVVQEEPSDTTAGRVMRLRRCRCPIDTAADLLGHCRAHGSDHPGGRLAQRARLARPPRRSTPAWNGSGPMMRECVYRGGHTEGRCPAGSASSAGRRGSIERCSAGGR